MSSLATKYRPSKLEDIVGQDIVKKVLIKQVEQTRFRNAYGFFGASGCGKTTAARAFAKAINHGIGDPIEVDGTTSGDVDSIKQIVETANRRDVTAEYKVIIVDECQMLGGGRKENSPAWSALLKCIEECPKYTIFIFCSTNPEKIPATILSRVQRYNFQKISNEGIVDRLNMILEKESDEIDNLSCKLNWEQDALEFISKVSSGGMRDAITLLDKCLSLSHDVTLENVLKTIGAEDYSTFITFLSALEGKEKEISIKVVEDVYNAGKDVKQFMKDFAKFVLEVEKYALYKNFDYISLPNTLENELERLIDDSLFDIMDFVVSLNSQIKWDNDPKTLIELSILIYCGKEI